MAIQPPKTKTVDQQIWAMLCGVTNQGPIKSFTVPAKTTLLKLRQGVVQVWLYFLTTQLVKLAVI